MGDTERTNVIVVGAGASKEFGLPTGEGLTSAITSFCRLGADDFGRISKGDPILRRIIDQLAHRSGDRGRLDDYFRAANQIADNMPLAPSIDNFLDTRRDDPSVVEIGKLAIAACILRAERVSKLMVPTNNSYNKLDFSKVQGSWIERFFKILVAQRDFAQFLEALERITFVSFNYDRCIQQFFLHAARSYFNLDQRQCELVRSSLLVVHPYGSLGDLSWKGLHTDDFGSEFSEGSLPLKSEGIQTFTEGARSTKIRPSIMHAMENCDVLLFLGFSFLPLNMKLITPDEPVAVKRIIATGKGQSQESQSMVRAELAEHFAAGNLDAVSVVQGTCAELFYEHHRFLITEQPV